MMSSNQANVKEQIEQYKLGTADFIDEAELKNKLTKKKKLRLKFGADPTRPDLLAGIGRRQKRRSR